MDSLTSWSWSMTVVRMQGMQSLRPDARWRPEVSISFDDDGAQSQTFVLGIDGRNPNLKTLVSIPQTIAAPASGSRLSIQVFCRAPSAKKREQKSAPLCFALVPLSDVFKNRDPSRARRGFEHEVALIRVNAIGGKTATASQNLREALKLVLRFHVVPQEAPRPLQVAPQVLTSATPLQLTATDDGVPETHEPRHVSPGSDQESDAVVPTDCEAGPSSCPTPKAKVPAFSEARGSLLRKRSVDSDTAVQVASCSAPPIPHHRVNVNVQPERRLAAEPTDRQADRSAGRTRTWLHFAEHCVSYLGPYDELREAEGRFDDRQTEMVLARLVTEWQSVGQMLVGLAAVNTAVVGFTKGSTTFAIDDFSLGAVTIGAIAAGLGMAMDAWFFLLFSGADVTKFKRLAKDLYGTYFFFCLACRLPTMHMFVSALALGLFLLSTAWVHSPTIALVIFCVFGAFVGSQMFAYVLRARFKRCGRTRLRRPRRTLSALQLRGVGQTISHRPIVSSPGGSRSA